MAVQPCMVHSIFTHAAQQASPTRNYRHLALLRSPVPLSVLRGCPLIFPVGMIVWDRRIDVESRGSRSRSVADAAEHSQTTQSTAARSTAEYRRPDLLGRCANDRPGRHDDRALGLVANPRLA